MSDYLQEQFGLDGRTALVTGASRGIGNEIALAMAAAGADVIVHYHRSADAADQTVQKINSNGGGRAWAMQADLADSDAAAALFDQISDRIGRLDILVNNAGDLIQRCAIADLTDELIDQVLRVNVHSALYACRGGIPLLRNGTHPVIINLSSIAAHNGGANHATLYASAKGAIHTFTRGLAKELAPDIRVNAIAPGVIHTDFHRVHSTPQTLETIAGNTPLKRLGRPEECAGAAVYLASNAASFVTGEVIEVNGGLYLA